MHTKITYNKAVASSGALALVFKNGIKTDFVKLLDIHFLQLFGSTYTKIGTMIQRRLAWPLCKDDTQIREAFLI